MSRDSQTIKLGFIDAFFEKNKIWFLNRARGEIFNYDFNKQKLTFVAEFSTENPKVGMLVRRIINYKNYLYFVSNNGLKIFKGHINEEDFVSDAFFENGNSSIVIKEAFLVDGEIYCIPSKINQPIVIFDIEKECFKESKSLTYWCHQFNVKPESNDIMTIKNYGGKFYFTLDSGTSLIEYDIRNKHVVEHFISGEMKISGFEIDGKNFWFRNKKGFALYRWNSEEGIIGSYLLEDMDELEQSECNAKVISVSSGRIILLPIFSDSIVYLDEKEGCLRRVNSKEEFCHISGMEKASFSIGNIEIDNKLLLFPWAEEKLIYIDLEKMEAESYPMEIGQEYYDKMQWLQWKRYPVQHESEDNELVQMIDLIKKGNIFNNRNTNIVCNEGRKIYNEVYSAISPDQCEYFA